MSDDYGTYAPAPEVPGMPPAPEPPFQPPVKKRKTGLIIAIVVGLVLAVCGIGVIVGAFFIFSSDGDVVTDDSSYDWTDDTSDSSTGDRMADWLAWDPIVDGELPEPPAANDSLVDEAIGIIAPGFTITDVGYSPGWIDDIEEWYYGDLYLVCATHPSSDKVSAAIEFTLQSDDMIADGVGFETEEGDVLSYLAGSTVEMISYGSFENADFTLDSADGEALWVTIGEDWPDSVVQRIWTETSTEVTVALTKWHLYNIDDYSPTLWITYELYDGTWEVTYWEYDTEDDY